MKFQSLFAFGCAVLVTACQPAAPDTLLEIPRENDRIVATVDGSAVYASDVRRAAAAQGLIAEGDGLSPETVTFARTLDGLIDQRLLARDAAAQNLPADPEAMRRLATARERILGNLRVERMLSETITEDALRDLYAAQNRLAAGGPERRLRQILVADEDMAADLAVRLDDEEDFSELAREFSTDTASAEAGGETGWTTRGALPAALRGPVFALNTGMRTEPIQTPAGFHIVEVIDRRSNADGGPSFEDVREDLSRFMTLEAVERLMTDLRRDADIVRGEDLPDPSPDTDDETTP